MVPRPLVERQRMARDAADDLPLLEQVEMYRYVQVLHGQAAVTFKYALEDLSSETAPQSYLKVRPLFQWRIDFWKNEFQDSSFLMSQAFCAKKVQTESGSSQLWIFVPTHARTHVRTQNSQTRTRTGTYPHTSPHPRRKGITASTPWYS